MLKPIWRHLATAIIVCAHCTPAAVSATTDWSSTGTAGHAVSENAKDLFLVQLKNPEKEMNNGFVFTLELHRPNQPAATCVPGDPFFSGDGIRVRIKSNFSGYAYIVMVQGSTGRHGLLFPASGPANIKGHGPNPDNFVMADHEYVIPSNGLIRFDNNPGVERLLFILSRKEIDLDHELNSSKPVSGSRNGDALEKTGLLIDYSGGNGKAEKETYVVTCDTTKVIFVEVPLQHASPPATAAVPAVPTPVAETSSPTPIITPAVPVQPANISPSSLPTSISPVTAATPPDSINRPVTDKWAVLLALSKYRDSSLDLRAPRKDAEAFADFLIADAGFSPGHVIKLYDKEATRDNLFNTLTALGTKIRPDDLFVFYANCHGSANTQAPGNFLLLYDYTGEHSLDRQLLMQDLSKILKSKVLSDRMVLLVQSCHSGFVKAGSMSSPAAISNELQGIGRIVATACAGDESSWVYRRGGVFTMALIPNLKKYPKLKEALIHTRQDVITETNSEEETKQMHPVIKYDLWQGDDAVLMATPTNPQP